MKSPASFALCLGSLVLLAGFAAAAPAPQIKLRKSGRGTQSLVELTPEGVTLEAEYTSMLDTLREEIKQELPAVDEAKQAHLLALLEAELGSTQQLANVDKALRNTRAAEDNYTALVEKLRAAPARLAEAEKKLQAALAIPDSDPDKEKLVTGATKQVDGAKANLAKLPKDVEKAKAAFDNAGAEEARLVAEVEAANKACAAAKTDTWKALDSLGLDGLLGSDTLDAKLARFIVLSHGQPRFLAQFAQQGPEKKKLLDQLLADTPLMLEMMVADGPFWGKYGEAMEIYQAIRKASPKAGEGVLRRLAVATSLVHAVPMPERVAGDPKSAVTTIDPVKRYLSYEQAFLAGELDPAFKDLTTWELTYLVDGEDSDEALAWGREMMRSYRPDLIRRDYNELRYSQIVDDEIQYTGQFVGEDRPELTFMQNILADGGICGRRAFFGRFVLRAFGIPTVERPEPGHATLVQWAPDGWIPYLGANWGGRARIVRYGRDSHFLAASQARGNEQGFMRVKRAQWIGDVIGEPLVLGLHEPKEKPQFWYSVSLAEQSRAGDGKKANVKNPLPPPTTVEAPSSEKAVTVDAAGAITIPAVATRVPADNIVTSGWGRLNVVTFMDSNLGGMQLHYSRYGGSQVLEYTFEAPRAGMYELTARMVSTRWDMNLLVSANGAEPVEMPIPFTRGLWETTAPILVKLEAGANTLTFARADDMRKGIAIRDFKLTPVK
jgi:tetratricopeptide (TPR) repeat protein